MRAPSEIILVALVTTTILGLAHYYIWRRLIRDALLPRRIHLTISVLLVLLLLSQPLTLILMRDIPRHYLVPLAYVAFVWMGLLSSYFVLLSLSDLIKQLRRLFTRLTKKADPGVGLDMPSHATTSRRQALGRMFAGGIAFGGATLGGVGAAQARELKLVHRDITLDKLPMAFDGFKIVQMSDVHVGPMIGEVFVKKIVALANEQAPDLIAITGDLVDGSVRYLSAHTAPLRALSARSGVFFVTGNHEYYSGVDEWINELARLGIPTLRNDAVRIERDNDSFLVAGVTDYRAARYEDAPDLARALRNRHPNEEVVLLAHQPRALSEAADFDVGLQLSGHTHGGQFWPWTWVIHLIEPVVSGWAQRKRTQIYVNSGTGYWGPPMRIGTTAELTVITLRARRDSNV